MPTPILERKTVHIATEADAGVRVREYAEHVEISAPDVEDGSLGAFCIDVTREAAHAIAACLVALGYGLGKDG